MKRIAYYPGSFDPMTNGHLDILRQAAGLADEVIIGIGVHPGKRPFLEFDERAKLIGQVVKSELGDVDAEISVQSFDGLVVEAAQNAKATVLVRGIRDGTDLDYEMQMSGMNGTLNGAVQTVFCPASPQVRHITATLVRQIFRMKGDISPFVPNSVLSYLDSKEF